MDNSNIPSELEARITELENPKNQGGGFSSTDWALLALTGIIFPLILLIWGW